jgi:hypothetical protein
VRRGAARRAVGSPQTENKRSGGGRAALSAMRATVAVVVLGAWLSGCAQGDVVMLRGRGADEADDAAAVAPAAPEQQQQEEQQHDVRLRWQACDEFEASEVGDVLHVHARVGGLERAWELERVTGLYAKPAQAVAHGGASFKMVRPGEGWAVAHRSADGAVHGSWFSASDGAVWEFSSASRLSQLLAPGAPGRALADASGSSRVLAASSSSSAVPRCGEPPAVTELASAVEAARATGVAFLADWNSEPRGTPILTPPEDPYVFWGRGTCFPEDYNTHTFRVGLMLHSSFVALYGSLANARAAMEAAFVTGSVVYQYQFNVVLQLGEVMDVSSAPAAAAGLLTSCPGSSVLDALGPMSSVVTGLKETQGVWTLLTNCYPASKTGGGIMGVANMGASGCGFQSRGWNIGVVNTSPGLWRTLAHELGHGFNMRHSFENGVGKTGGLMDYGNPLINGVPRFRIERAAEACAMFSSLKANRCAMLASTGKHQTPPPTRAFPTAKPTKGPPGVKPQPTPRPTAATPAPTAATPAPTPAVAAPGCKKGSTTSLFSLSDAGNMCAKLGQRLCTVAELKKKQGICSSSVYWTSGKCSAGGSYKYVASTQKASCVSLAASQRRSPFALAYAASCCAA